MNPGFAHWMQRHAVSPAEAVTVPYLIWAALVMRSSVPLNNPRSPINHQLTAFAPIWGWELALIGCAVVVLFGLLTCRPYVARVGYVLAGALWLLLIWVLWQATHSRILAGPYVFVAITTLWRSGQLAPRSPRRSAQ